MEHVMLNIKLTLQWALPLVVAVCLQACTNDDKNDYIHYQGYKVPNPTKHLVLTNVYSYQQTTNYTCGPSAVMTLLQHYGKLSMSQMNRETEMRIAKEMNTTESGTSQMELVAWLRKNGFSVEYGQNVTLDMLINNINRGIPTIIAWNDLSEHAMVVVGYNSAGVTPTGSKDVVFAADPASSGSIEANGVTIRGIDSLSPDQLEYNQVEANFFNPSHSVIGMYIIAVPH
jgi:hypothetical protein